MPSFDESSRASSQSDEETRTTVKENKPRSPARMWVGPPIPSKSPVLKFAFKSGNRVDVTMMWWVFLVNNNSNTNRFFYYVSTLFSINIFFKSLFTGNLQWEWECKRELSGTKLTCALRDNTATLERWTLTIQL